MRIAALATDYDGTIAWNGAVNESTIAALERWKESGRSLLLVTGREVPELRRIFPELGIFDRVVAENGGVLVRPGVEDVSHELPALAGAKETAGRDGELNRPGPGRRAVKVL